MISDMVKGLLVWVQTLKQLHLIELQEFEIPKGLF